MAELKTKETKQNPKDFLKTILPKDKQEDCLELIKIFQKVTGKKAVLWGTSIVGFGKYHYKSERSIQEGDWPLVAFSPRKQNITLYIMIGNNDKKDLLLKLGKYKVSGSCLHIKKLSDVNEKVLERMIKNCFVYMKKLHQ